MFACNTCEGKLSGLAHRSLYSLGFGHSRRFGVAKASADAADAAGVLAVHPRVPLRECLKKMAEAGRRPHATRIYMSIDVALRSLRAYASPLYATLCMYLLAASGAHAVAVVSETGYL